MVVKKVKSFPFYRKEYFVTMYRIGSLIGQGTHSKVYKAL